MKTNRILMALLLVAILLAGCDVSTRVGDLRSESRSVALDGSEAVNVEVDFGAGELSLSGGAEELMQADFTYNVAKLKPVVEYEAGSLVVRQPSNDPMPNLVNINEFRNEWDLSLYDGIPMDLTVKVGAGDSDIQLAGLSLKSLKVDQGAGTSTIDFSGEWPQDMSARIDAGAADLTVILPEEVGVRIEVDRGATMLDAPDFSEDDGVYTNAAYDESDVTLRIKISGGIGFIHLLLAESL